MLQIISSAAISYGQTACIAGYCNFTGYLAMFLSTVLRTSHATSVSLRHIAGHVISAADLNGHLGKLSQKQTFLFRNCRKDRPRPDVFLNKA